MLPALLSLFGGLVLLVIASDWAVDGAVAVARRVGLSMLVVGLTIVAYGTSFPELMVSLLAARRDVDEFAIGNIVGSNVANIGMVLGATALAAPFVVQSRVLFRRDLPLLALATGLAVFFFLDDVVGRLDGLILLVVAVAFTILCLRQPAEADVTSEGEDAEEPAPWGKAALLLVFGFTGLLVGAHFMVEGGREIALRLGISERVVGLTVVAIGTSLPELAASMAGALKGYPALAVGNVVGSCLFNLAFVLGASSLLQPMEVHLASIRWDLVVMVAITGLMAVMLRTGRRMTRGEGGALVVIYAAFLTHLVVDAMA